MTEYISSREAQNNFGAMLDKAQRDPVVIRRYNRDCAVLISVQDYALLQEMRRLKLQRSLEALRAEADEGGLTPEMLEKLLEDDV